MPTTDHYDVVIIPTLTIVANKLRVGTHLLDRLG
jgi:hypothetical protein